MGVVMKIITGIGPRVGTSFLMYEAKKAGLPVAAPKFIDRLHVKQQNPSGYWEFDPQDIKEGLLTNKWDNNVVKLWAWALPFINQSNDNKVVVLERKDKEQQRESVRQTLKLEEEKFNITTGLSANDILEEHVSYMYKWINSNPTCDLIHVYTEDLNKDLQYILNYLGGT